MPQYDFDGKVVAITGAASGIRINAICPGTARSRMVDEWIVDGGYTMS